MPNTNSNKIIYATLDQTDDFIQIPSGTAINTDTVVTTAAATDSTISDILFRNLAVTTINFDIIICPTGQNATAKYNTVQIQVPASAGNNGTTARSSLVALTPNDFDLDLSGNRIIGLKAGMSIYLRNKAALTADIIVRVKRKNF